MAAVQRACDIIKQHYDSLHALLADPNVVSKLIFRLHHNELITYSDQCLLDDCAGRGSSHQATALLTIVMNSVIIDDKYFEKFVRVLKEDPVLCPTAVHLLKSYRECQCSAQNGTDCESETDLETRKVHNLNMQHFEALHIKMVDASSTSNEGKQSKHLRKLLDAAKKGKLQVLRKLIEKHNLDPLLCSQDGDTALHISSLNGCIEVVKYLVNEQKCNPMFQNALGRTCLHYASCRGNVDIAKFLVEEAACNPSFPDADGTTPLHFAAVNGSMKLVQYFAEVTKCDCMAKNCHGCTPLAAACAGGHLDVVRYFIDKQLCDPFYQDEYGNSILHWASLDGNIDVVQYLVDEKGIDPSSSRNLHGVVALHYASERGYLKLVKYLIKEKRCDPNYTDNHGNSALHFCAAYGSNIEVIEYLVQCCGPKICSLTNKYDLTPIDFAITFNHQNVVDYLAKVTDTKLKRIRQGLPPRSKFKTDKDGRTLYTDYTGKSVQWSHPSVHESLGPLPCGWQVFQKADGQIVFVNIDENKTSLNDPRVSNKIYRDALQQSYINAFVIKVVITGAVGSGKTQVLQLLRNELPSPVYHSTPLWANPIQDLRKLPTTAIRCKTPTQDIIDTVLSESLNYIECKAATSASTLPSDSIQSMEMLKRKFKARKNKGIDIPQELAPMPIAASAPLEVGWIHYLDTGGMTQFHHILPLFVQHADCKIIVSDLSHRHDDSIVVGYSSKDSKYSTIQQNSISINDAAIIPYARLLQSVDQNGDSLSKVLVVGTHRDCTGVNVELADQDLQSLLNPVLNKSLLYNNPGKNKLMFPLNACNPGEEDELVANDLCTAILSLTEYCKPTSISLRWMLFHQELKVQASETNEAIVEFKACSKVANSLFLSDEDVIAALEFFTQYNIFMYYKSILPGIVFTNPQALSDLISQLLVKLGNSSKDGIISFDMIEKLVGNTSSLFKPGLFIISDFIHLLLSLKIISTLKNGTLSDLYFMPAILSELNKEEIRTVLAECQNQANIQPLLIHYSSPLVPCGTFCRLIVSLLSLDSWQVACKLNSNSPICANSNCIVLLFERHILVTMCDRISFIEINADGDQEAACCRIKAMIIKELGCGMEKPQVAFYCPCQLIDSKLSHSDCMHTATLSNNTLICSADTKQTFPMHVVNIKPWFGEECPEATHHFVHIRLNDEDHEGYLMITDGIKTS